MNRKIRILLAAAGPEDNHRDAKAAARAFRDAGCEVIFMGIESDPAALVNVRLQEDADAIGLWGWDAGLREAFTAVIRLLAESGAGNVVVFGGGNAPADELRKILDSGATAFFCSGGAPPDFGGFVKDLKSRKRKEDARG